LLASALQMPENYRTLTKRLIDERSTKVEDVAEMAKRLNPERGRVSISLVQKRLAPGNRTQPSKELLAALAAALEIEPESFIEYRLASIRKLFDERPRLIKDKDGKERPGGVGFEEAIKNLEGLLALAGEQKGATPLVDLARRLRAALPSPKDRRQGGSPDRSRQGRRKRSA
jgi:transcriptional regulator with XRE-family HTH domain